MPQGDGTGPQGLGPGTGRKRGGGRDFGTGSHFQKSTLLGSLFSFGAMLVGNWLDKKLSQKRAKGESEQDKSN